MTASLSACGTITGQPSHGGGKRFAIEQELIASSARKAVKSMDLEALEGKKVALYISAIGDQGSGNFTGGRYSITNLIRGEYQNLPHSITEYSYPEYTTVAETNTDGLSGTTISNSVLNAPIRSKNNQEGRNIHTGVEISGGNSEYKNETLIQNPQDSVFLSRLIQTVLFLRGIEVIPNEAADAFLFVNVGDLDTTVFGTIRNNGELFFFWIRPRASRAIDRNSRILIKPEVNSFAARYKENYILWTGPLSKNKSIEEADKLLVDFSDITPYSSQNKFSSEIEELRKMLPKLLKTLQQR
ncbi:MAG: hypothetical protein J6M05_02910 [Cardiobacteriaceae bacterium]|nr:hypothetical protein [Cardiobacteriaceae bacterium]